jgi:hypothetical protein
MDDDKDKYNPLLEHMTRLAKKAGMSHVVFDEISSVIREQQKIDEKQVTLQSTQIHPNVPFDMQSLLGQMKPPNKAKEAFRTGWKADDQWDCFIEVEVEKRLSTDELEEVFATAQCEANTEGVPVRVIANGFAGITYPGGKWVDGLTQWHETRLTHREQAKVTANFNSFSISPKRLVMRLLKSRTPKKGENPHQAFSSEERMAEALKKMIGED